MALSRTSHSSLRSQPLLSLLFLFCLVTSVLATSAVIGVDLGTEYIKAALVKPGIPLEIVLTKDSRRKEASAVAFKPSKNIKSGNFPERAYGSDATALAARFPGDVYPNLKTLLGLGADNSVVQEYALRHPALKLEAEKTRGTAAFRSSAFADDELPWIVEEILAMELQSIQKNAEALAGKGSRIRDLVITVPPFYTVEEKRAVVLAADLAGLRVLELISDGLAVGLNYATTRTFPSITEGGKPEIHMVFDMGAGSAKASVLKCQGRTVKDVGKYNKTIQEVHVLGSGWDRTLGGDALNTVIVDDMITQFISSPAAKSISPTVEAVRGHGRAAAKLWKDAERLRQILSANTNTQASFEGLYEDVDFKYKITRADFETMTEAYAARIPITMQKALDAAGVSVKDLDSIILHGGTVRTPFVQRELEKFIGDASKVRTNVNADEAAVFGAGFRGAALSPSFRVKEIRSYEGASYAAGVKWTNVNDKPQQQKLWQPTSILGAEKQYTFKNQQDPFVLDFYQDIPSSENVSPGLAEKELMSLTSQNLTDSVARLKDKFGCTDADINVKLSTRLSNEAGEVEITRFVVECEAEAKEEKESMVDSVKGMFGFGKDKEKKDQMPLSEEGETSSTSSPSSTMSETSSSTSASTSASASAKDTKDTKAKSTKRMQVIPVAFTTEKKGTPQLPKSEVTRMQERISAFDDSDRARRSREEALNQLEGFTYKVRDILEDAEFIAASTDRERADLETKSQAASEWIYSDGRDATREELKSKMKEMRDIVTPVEFRKSEATQRPLQLKSLQDALNQTDTLIKGIMEQIANETKKHEDFTSSRSAKEAASATATPSPVADDFAGLEDEEAATTTSSAPIEVETLDPPVYTHTDLIRPQRLFDETSAWLKEKLPLQEKLTVTDDPVLLSKDLAAKAKELTDLHVELIMKSMRQPYRSQRPPPKKSKTSKAPKKTAKKDSKASDYVKAGASFKVGANDEMPSEEEILSFLEKQNAKDAADEKQKMKTTGGEAGGKEEKHDEL